MARRQRVLLCCATELWTLALDKPAWAQETQENAGGDLRVRPKCHQLADSREHRDALTLPMSTGLHCLTRAPPRDRLRDTGEAVWTKRSSCLGLQGPSRGRGWSSVEKTNRGALRGACCAGHYTTHSCPPEHSHSYKPLKTSVGQANASQPLPSPVQITQGGSLNEAAMMVKVLSAELG